MERHPLRGAHSAKHSLQPSNAPTAASCSSLKRSKSVADFAVLLGAAPVCAEGQQRKMMRSERYSVPARCDLTQIQVEQMSKQLLEFRINACCNVEI